MPIHATGYHPLRPSPQGGINVSGARQSVRAGHRPAPFDDGLVRHEHRSKITHVTLRRRGGTVPTAAARLDRLALPRPVGTPRDSVCRTRIGGGRSFFCGCGIDAEWLQAASARGYGASETACDRARLHESANSSQTAQLSPFSAVALATVEVEESTRAREFPSGISPQASPPGGR